MKEIQNITDNIKKHKLGRPYFGTDRQKGIYTHKIKIWQFILKS